MGVETQSMRSGVHRIATIVALISIHALSLGAATPEELKTRIQSRIPKLTVLFEQGLAREGTDGLVKPDGSNVSEDQKRVIDEENKDRKEVIALVARASGLSEQDVAQRFAARALKNMPSAVNRPVGTCKLVPPKGVDIAKLTQRYKGGMAFVSQGRFEQALAEFKETLAIEPNFVGVRQNMAAAYLRLKRFKEAETALKDEISLLNCLRDLPERDLAKFAYMFDADKPENQRGQAQISRIKEVLAKARPSILYHLACLFAIQNIRSLAFTRLTESVQEGFSDAELLERDPDLSNIRNSQEFQEILYIVRARQKK